MTRLSVDELKINDMFCLGDNRAFIQLLSQNGAALEKMAAVVSTLQSSENLIHGVKDKMDTAFEKLENQIRENNERYERKMSAIESQNKQILQRLDELELKQQHRVSLLYVCLFFSLP